MHRSLWLPFRSVDISYIHHTSDYRQYCHVGNTAQHCRLGLFQDSDFAGDFEDSQSTSGWILCIFGSRTFVLITWMCKKQTSVSHSSTESEIISLDAGLRMDGLPALDHWDMVIEVLRSTNNTARHVKTNPRRLVHDKRPFPSIKTQPKHQLKREREGGALAATSHISRTKANLSEWSMTWLMLILFPQTSNLLIRKLCCMCLKTTKQWSRW